MEKTEIGIIAAKAAVFLALIAACVFAQIGGIQDECQAAYYGFIDSALTYDSGSQGE